MFGGEWRSESGGWEAKINTPISTNAPSCIAIALLNCRAHIKILILPLVLLAAKADVYERDLCEDQPVLKNPVSVKHNNAYHKRWIRLVHILLQRRTLQPVIVRVLATPLGCCHNKPSLRRFPSQLVNTAKYSLADTKRSLNHYLSSSGLLSMQALQQQPSPNLTTQFCAGDVPQSLEKSIQSNQQLPVFIKGYFEWKSSAITSL